MEQVRDLLLPVERITPGDGHYFFGYYDVPAWSADGTRHLCHRVGFYDRLPAEHDVATVGWIDLADGAFKPLGETVAWNFQQGAMLQWHPTAPNDEVIFNRRTDQRCMGVILETKSGRERLLSMPVANVDRKGRYALSISFSRMFTFRPGYGYAGLRDRYHEIPQPEGDGIWRVDLGSGEGTLILSLKDVAAACGSYQAGHKLLINHITFNTDGTRFVFLARTFLKPPDPWWRTAVFTADVEGRDLRCLVDYGLASHYHWLDSHRLLMWCDPGQGAGLYLLTDRSRTALRVDPGFFQNDGHCNYSPDRHWLLYDSYPQNGYRYLYLYHVQKKRGLTLGGFFSDPRIDGDFRCDLHPRWNPAGTMISFDSIHEGSRQVYRMDLSSLVKG